MLKRSTVLHLAAAILAYAALWILVPRATFLPAILQGINMVLPFVPTGVGDALSAAAMLVLIAPTVAFMTAQVSIVYFFAKLRMGLGWSLAVLIGCLLLTQALMALMMVLYRWTQFPGLRDQLDILGHYFGPLKLPMSLLFMFVAASVGYLVSLRVKDRNLILPVVMFAAYIDFWTVTQGPVAMALKHAPDVVRAVSAPIPQAGAGTFVPVTLMGPGDALFMALVFAAVHRLKMNGSRNYAFVLAAMTLGMLTVMTGLLTSLPALIVLAAAVIIANWREFRLTRQELVAMLIVALLLVASLPIIWAALRSKAEKQMKPKTPAPVSAPARVGN